MKNPVEGARPNRSKALVIPQQQKKAVTNTTILHQPDGRQRTQSGDMAHRQPSKLAQRRFDRTEHDGSDHLL